MVWDFAWGDSLYEEGCMMKQRKFMGGGTVYEKRLKAYTGFHQEAKEKEKEQCTEEKEKLNMEERAP